MKEHTPKKAIWPREQRGEDMEQAIKQQQAADLLSLAKLALIKKRKGC